MKQTDKPDWSEPDPSRNHKDQGAPRLLIALSGVIWLGVGLFLFSIGSSFILRGCQEPASFSIARYLARTVKDPGQISVILLSTGIFLGYLKGRFVLSKTAEKQVTRLLHLPRPVRIKQLYTKGYYLLLMAMIGLGIVLRYLPVSLDVRGTIDVAIGMALVSGAIQYFRRAISLPLSPSRDSFSTKSK